MFPFLLFNSVKFKLCDMEYWKCMLSDVWILEAILLSFPLLFPSLDELDLGKSHSMDP